MRIPPEAEDRHASALKSLRDCLAAAASDGANVRQYLDAAITDIKTVAIHDHDDEITRLRLRLERCLELQRQCELGARSIETQRVVDAAWQRAF